MDTIGQTLHLFWNQVAGQLALATLTFSGMVLTMLGAFYVIDAVRLPNALGRTGLPLLSIFDEIVVVRGIPLQPLKSSQSALPRLLQIISSGALGAAAFAIVIGVGYRHGVVGAIIGATLGLGLGLGVALRPVVHWLARRAGLSFFFISVRAIINVISFYSGAAIFFLFEVLLFLVLFIMVIAVWIILLPWLLFVWIVRKIRKQPSTTGALLAPIAFPLAVRSSAARASKTRPWRDPNNLSASARLTRWALGLHPKFEAVGRNLIIGALYGIVGQIIVTNALGSAASSWLLLGSLVVFGFVAERIFEVIVESLFLVDFRGFYTKGQSILTDLRVGLLTGLSLGTIVGLTTGNKALIHSFVNLTQNAVPENVVVVITVSVFVLLLWLLPTILALFAEWLTNRMRHIRIGLWTGGITLLLAGTTLQWLQYVIAVR